MPQKGIFGDFGYKKSRITLIDLVMTHTFLGLILIVWDGEEHKFGRGVSWGLPDHTVMREHIPSPAGSPTSFRAIPPLFLVRPRLVGSVPGGFVIVEVT